MAYTENEIYYPYDYDASADVPQDMKTMAESIDEVVGEIKGTQTTQNTRLSALETGQTSQSTSIQALQSENTRLKQNQIYGTATGTEVEITDSAEMGASIGVGGESEQETRSGKNKLFSTLDIMKARNAKGSWNNNVYTFNGITFTVNDDLSITTGGTFTSRAYFYINQSDFNINQGNYLLNGCPANGGNSTYIIACDVIGETTTTVVDIGTGTSIDVTSIANPKLDAYIDIRSSNGVGKTFYPMIRLATEEDDTYEPYGAMPSPEFPSEIKNLTGDTVCKVRGINLLDLSKCSRFTNCILQDDGSLKSNINNSYFCNLRTTELNDFLLEHKGETITFSIDKAIQNKNVTILIQGTRTTGLTYQESAGEGSIRNVSMSIADDFTQIDYLELRWNRAFPAFTDTTTVVTELMLCLGENTDYEPYQEPKTITFPFGAQKLCRKSNTEYDYLSDEGIVNILEQTDNTGTKTIEESFSLRETPLVTPYTTAQQTAYDNLQNLILFEGYNHIEMISPNGVKANLTVDYTKSTQMVINDIEERLSALEYAGLEV